MQAIELGNINEIDAEKFGLAVLTFGEKEESKPEIDFLYKKGKLKVVTYSVAFANFFRDISMDVQAQ